MFNSLKHLKKFYQPYIHHAIIGSIVTLLFALLAQVDPYVTGRIIDAVLQNQDTEFVIIGCLVIMGGVTMFRTFLRYQFFMAFERFSQETIYDLREALYKKLQGLDIGYYERVPNGKIMSKMTADIEAIRHFLAWITHVSLFHSAVFIFAIISMFIINPILTSTLLLIVPFICFFSLLGCQEV